MGQTQSPVIYCWGRPLWSGQKSTFSFRFISICLSDTHPRAGDCLLYSTAEEDHCDLAESLHFHFISSLYVLAMLTHGPETVSCYLLLRKVTVIWPKVYIFVSFHLYCICLSDAHPRAGDCLLYSTAEEGHCDLAESLHFCFVSYLYVLVMLTHGLETVSCYLLLRKVTMIWLKVYNFVSLHL